MTDSTPAADRARPRTDGRVRARRLARLGFVEPQLCKLVSEAPRDCAWVHEIKFDGYRSQAHVFGAETTIYSRNGLDWTARYPEIARAAAGLPDGVYDGEICALDADGMPDFAGLVSALKARRTGRLVFFVFDVLQLDGRDLRPRPLLKRKAALAEALEDAPSRIRYVDHFEGPGPQFHRSACSMALEGVVSKRVDAPYASGRTGTWVKAKCRAGQEVVVGGWEMNGPSFRSLLTGVWRDGRLEYVGSVGSGFGAAQVADVLPRLRAIEAERSPFSGPRAPRKTAAIHWCRPELVAEIEIGGWVGDDRGKLRQASFKGLREDKPAEDVGGEA